MRRSQTLSALLALVVGAGAVSAQSILVPGPYSGNFSYGSRHGRVTVSLRTYGLGYAVPSLYAWPSSQVFVFYSPPPPSIIFLPQPPADQGDIDLQPVPRRRPPREEQPPLPPREVVPPPAPLAPLLPGNPASVFRPIRPADRDRAQQPVPPEPAPKPADRGRFFPPEEPGLRRPPPPEADPKTEAARLIALGKDAIASAEYARAADRFRQASQLDPNEPRGYFLLAQAYFALGKYPEAVRAIEAGMRLNPDWPKSTFRPFELYGPNITEFTEHLHLLEKALERHPHDPVLVFLYAYELWFDGRQEEALPLLQRALNLAPGKAFIRQFLLARPAGPVVQR